MFLRNLKRQVSGLVCSQFSARIPFNCMDLGSRSVSCSRTLLVTVRTPGDSCTGSRLTASSLKAKVILPFAVALGTGVAVAAGGLVGVGVGTGAAWHAVRTNTSAEMVVAA